MTGPRSRNDHIASIMHNPLRSGFGLETVEGSTDEHLAVCRKIGVEAFAAAVNNGASLQDALATVVTTAMHLAVDMYPNLVEPGAMKSESVE